MKLTQSNFGDVTVVKLIDNRLDATISVRFKDAMRDLSDNGAQHVILDMSSVSFMDSSGLGAIVAVKKLLGPDKIFELSELTPMVEKVFRLTRMDRVFRVHPSLSGALSESEKLAG